MYEDGCQLDIVMIISQYIQILKKRIILVRALGLFMTKTQLQTAQAYGDIY